MKQLSSKLYAACQGVIFAVSPEIYLITKTPLVSMCKIMLPLIASTIINKLPS